jgi:hypothetical protein
VDGFANGLASSPSVNQVLVHLNDEVLGQVVMMAHPAGLPGLPDDDVVPQVLQDVRVVSNVAKSLVAVEAEHSSDLSGYVVVIDVLRSFLSAAEAYVALFGEDAINLGLTYSISPSQVVLAGAAVVLFDIRASTSVVTWPAVAAVSVPASSSVTRESFEGFE